MLKPSETMKGPKRLPGETQGEYKARREAEQSIIDEWLKGRPAKFKESK